MRKKLTTKDKTLASAKAIYEMAAENSSANVVSANLRDDLGFGWTIVSAAQYLTGKSAISLIESLPNDFSHNGLTKKEIDIALIVAHDLCANISPKGTQLSSGKHVSNFKA